jgi:Ca2+-binding RTX toxin-like protein
VDTLKLTAADNLSDFSFLNFHGIEALLLQGGSQILVGANAQSAGTTLIAATGAGNDTFTQTTADTLHLSLVGGTGKNTFFLYNTGLFSNDTIVGSGGANDLLTINDQANLNDASLANVHGVQTISLVGTSSATLGNNAQTNGIKALEGFYGGDIFTTNNTGTSLFGGGAYNFLTSTTTNNWLEGGNLSSPNVTTFNTNTLVGAAYNTLIGGRTTASGSSVNNSLVGNGDNDSIIGNSDNTGNDTIIAYGKSSTIIGGGGNDSIVAANVDDSIKLGNGKSSSTTLLEFTDTLSFTSATIFGGVGTNTLQIDQQTTLKDPFYNIAANSIDDLSLTGASAVSLYGSAYNAGITSVYGGNGGDTLFTNYAAYIQGGTGNDLIVGYYGNDTIVGNGGVDTLNASYASGGNNLFEFTTGAQLAVAYAVSGGSTLNNTVLFTQAGTITDTQLAPLSQIQTISLTGGSALTLGSHAQSAGIDVIAANTIAPAIPGSITVTEASGFTNILTVVGGAKTTSMDASSFNTYIILNHSASTLSGSLLGGTANDTLIAGSGNDTLQGYSGSTTDYVANSTLTGGSGSDLFILGDSTGTAYLGNIATINNFNAANDTLQLFDWGGANAGSDGYQTLSGGGNTIDIFAYFGTEPAYEVAVVNVSSGTFDWKKNATFV